MKRTISILLIFILVLSLVSCGKSEEYTYDFLSSEYPTVSRVYTDGYAIKGGAYLNVAMQNLEGESIRMVEGKNLMRCLFNEETKTIIPLCWDVTCEHASDNANCFGKLYGYSMESISGIYEDSVFSIRETYGVKNQLEVVYYGLDGIVLETVEYSPELVLPNGAPLEDRFMASFVTFLTVGSKVYFELVTEEGGVDKSFTLDPSNIKYLHWIVGYDLEDKEWDFVAMLPDSTYEEYLGFDDADDNRISIECEEKGTGYLVDTDTGAISVYDCAEILDEMISIGKIPVGTKILRVSAIQDYFVCDTGMEYIYCSISTEKIIDSSSVEQVVAGEPYKFTYNGERYVIVSKAGEFTLENVNTGENSSLATDGIIAVLFSETEHGLIFNYEHLLEDGSLGSGTYTVKENGKDVTYWYPQKYVYVTKEDILDGNIDEPWYYDAETYSFVQR